MDIHQTINEALTSLDIPVYYDHQKKPPQGEGIRYREVITIDTVNGDTISYGRCTYQIQFWSERIERIQQVTPQILSLFHSLGFTRTYQGEHSDGGLIIKTYRFRAPTKTIR